MTSPKLTYRSLLHGPQRRRIVVGRVLGNLAMPVMPLALVLLLTHPYGIVTAGVTVAAFSLAEAAGHILFSRMIDRGRQRIIGALGIAQAAASALLLLAVFEHTPAVIVVLVGALVGFTEPPIGVAMRALWHSLLTPAQYQVSSAWESILAETIYVIGPLFVAAVMLVATASTVIAVASLLSAVGCLLYSFAGPARHWRNPHPHDPVRLTHARSLWAPLLAAALWCSTYGAATVLITFNWQQQGHPAAGALIFGLVSVGGAIGGALFGKKIALNFNLHRLARATVLYGLGYMSFAFVTGSLLGSALLAIGAGIVNAVTLTGFYLWTSRSGPAGARTEVYAWAAAALSLGIAAGAAVAGILIPVLGVQTTTLLVLAPCLLAAALAARHQTPPPHENQAASHADETVTAGAEASR